MSEVIVVFEVVTNEEGARRYGELGAALRPLLVQTGGLISRDSYVCDSDPSRLLSVNRWENEEAVEVWRNKAEHRLAQMEGKDKLFSSYSVTVARVSRTYTDQDRSQAPPDSNRALYGS